MESEMFLFWFIFCIILLVSIVAAVVTGGNVCYYVEQALGKDFEEDSI